VSSSRGRILPVLIAAALLVGGANVAAYAATGGSFILGHTNQEGQPSTLQNLGDGPALKLQTKSSSPPLAVSSGRKVVKLNADRLDGLDSTSLLTRAVVYTVPFVPTTKQFTVNLPGLPKGVYLASYSLVAQMSTAGTNITCFFDLVDRTPFSGVVGYGSASGHFSNANSSGLVDTRHDPVTFSCLGGSSFTVSADESFSPYITLTRINGFTQGPDPTVQ
jgi:hypothetical protein